MDGAQWASVLGCQGKAMAAAAFGRTSGELQPVADSPIIRGIIASEGGHMIASQGAVPIIRDGIVIGACAATHFLPPDGGNRQDDENCAIAGVAQL